MDETLSEKINFNIKMSEDNIINYISFEVGKFLLEIELLCQIKSLETYIFDCKAWIQVLDQHPKHLMKEVDYLIKDHNIEVLLDVIVFCEYYTEHLLVE